MKHITRIERKHSGYGWMVRYRGHSKWFSDGKYGSKKKSLNAARFYLIELKKVHPAPPLSSGIPGLIKASIRSGERELTCYVVQIKDAGIYKRFYPHHYGSDAEAIQEALSFRRQKERELQLKEHIANGSDITFEAWL
jgi:hypothetical protein